VVGVGPEEGEQAGVVSEEPEAVREVALRPRVGRALRRENG
jgi:hypothetical protein